MGCDANGVKLAAAIFGIPLADYRRSGGGVLIGSGAGITMAIMDASARFRFALDMDECRGRDDALCSWIRALDRNRLVDLIALAGWFSISDPKKIAGALNSISTPAIAYSGAGLERSAFRVPLFDTLEDFLRHVDDPLFPGHRDERDVTRIDEHPGERAFEELARMFADNVD